jgi:taurine dioxygenase
MLNAVEVPASGGGTMFADQRKAFEALPSERQALAESITILHCYEGRTDGTVPTFRHPLVRRHPVTGRKALYAAADTGIGIAGMPDIEARHLLDFFAEHATQARFVYLHEYQPHDLVIWDNAQLLHSAQHLERATEQEMRRVMHRVSVRGWPPAPDGQNIAHG